MRKKINKNTRLSSTSDITIEDIVGAVADELPNNPCRDKIERIVKETVRPCALGGVPTVVAGTTSASSSGSVCSGSGMRIDIVCGNGGDAPSEYGCCGGSPDLAADGDCLMRRDTGSSRVNRVFGSRKEAQVGKNSRWFDIVLQNGEVWTPYTSRRFLPAQYLGLMARYDGNIDAGIARRYSIKDCFRLLEEEIEKLIFMEKHCRVAYEERKMFLSVEDCCSIFSQYLAGLQDNYNRKERCTFMKRTGEYVRTIPGYGRTTLWTMTEHHSTGANGGSLDTVSVEPSKWLVKLNKDICDGRDEITRIRTYQQALDYLRLRMPHVGMGYFKDSDGYIRSWLPKAWKEAFKKQGAYYTLKSLIVNRHVRYTTETGTWRNRVTESCETARDGLNKLRTLLSPEVPAYVVHAILKKSIDSSSLNISKFLQTVCRH